MKTMKFQVLCGLLFSCACVYADSVISRSQLFDGTLYEFTPGRFEAADIPRWTNKTNCPPLAPWSAVEKAQQFMTNIPPRSGMFWDLGSITLHRMSRFPELWLYKIRFHEDTINSTSPYDGPVQSFEVIVLMNGEVPKPAKRKR